MPSSLLQGVYWNKQLQGLGKGSLSLFQNLTYSADNLNESTFISFSKSP